MNTCGETFAGAPLLGGSLLGSVTDDQNDRYHNCRIRWLSSVMVHPSSFGHRCLGTQRQCFFDGMATQALLAIRAKCRQVVMLGFVACYWTIALLRGVTDLFCGSCKLGQQVISKCSGGRCCAWT